MKYSHYSELADLFDFPGAEYHLRMQALPRSPFMKSYPEAATQLQMFLDGIPEGLLDVQELYTRTFDVLAITTLDLGYVLFGDDYKRAELLSNLTREHNTAGIDCKGELADNLSNILRLMPKLEDQELLGELVSEILVPALMLMMREFDSERIEKKNANYIKHYKTLIEPAPRSDLTIYRQALAALFSVLKQDFDISETVEKLENWSSQSKTADFLGLVAKEMEIEENANPGNSGCDA
jgi:nitrate reductase assembly molybdenum cofactor insertion protein NarJ